MSSEPNGSFNFTADFLAGESCDAGDCLVKDEALGVWRVSTTAHRTSAAARTTAIARTAYGGSIVGKVMYQMSGRVPASMTGLGSGSASWVRTSATGQPERCTPAPGDDIIGKCAADGSMVFQPGVWDSTNISGGGGGATPGGADTQGQYNNAGAFGGMSGLLWNGATSRPDFPNGWRVTVSGQTGTFTMTPTGARTITFQDATQTVVGRDTTDTLTNKTINASNNTITDTSAATGDLFVFNGTRFARVAQGGNGTFWGVSGGVAGYYTPSASSNTLTNVGTGAQISKGLVASNYDIRSITGINSTAATQNTNDIQVALNLTGNSTEIMTFAGTTQISAATGVKAGTGFLSITTSGAAIASVGDIRLRNTATIVFRNGANSADKYFGTLNSTNDLILGSDASFTSATQVATIQFGVGTNAQFVVGVSTVFTVGAASVTTTQPILGNGSAFGAHGKATVTALGALTSAQYSRQCIEFGGSLNGTCTFPAPSDADHEYSKDIFNTNTGSTVTMSIGSGTTLGITGGSKGRYAFRTTGVFLIAN